ncbi:MAG TPA: hypothetical protein VJU84_08505 [Pyrinomonadaceae bacterium]|nr:hypothetical protein [Pyrinomonadaceae bacterium]
MNKKLFQTLAFTVCGLLSAVCCLAQGTPGTVRYPTLLDTPDSLFRIKDSSRTTLTSSINSSATSMTVASTSTFADSGSLKVGDEILYYTSKSSTQFLGLVRGASGTTAASHNAGSSVFAPILAAHHNTLADAIVATQTKLGQGASVPALNSVLAGTGAGSSGWSAQPAIDCTNCTNVPAPANLNASNLTSGTVPDARFPATLPAVSGANLTGLTKAQVGLSNVDNTSDAAKPVSTAQQAALDLKANIASPTFTGTPAAPTAAAGTNTTQIATTAHVFGERSNTATLTNKTLTSPVINTPTGITFSDISGSVTDAQVPNTITVDLATTASTANAGDSATAFFSSGTIEAVRLPALSALSGSITDAQVPNDITVDLATLATTATTANAGDSATAFFSSGTIEAARLGSGTADSTTFLRGDGSWQTVAGGGGLPSGLTFSSPDFTVATAAANQAVLSGSTSTNPVLLSAIGSDTNIDIKMVPKGTGGLRVGADTIFTNDVWSFGAAGSTQEIKMRDRNHGTVATVFQNGFAEVVVGRPDSSVNIAGTSLQVGGVTVPTISSTSTLTNKTFNLTSNTLSGTTAQFNSALSDNDFATLAGTETLTNKRVTVRVTSITSNATWSPSADTDDMYIVTAQAAAVTTINNPSGTPTVGQKLVIRVKDDGTARALTWSGSQWRASTDLALPTTTTLGKTMYLGFIWNGVDSKWDLIAKLDNF